MKLEMGMYIRTDLGEIGKVTSVSNDNFEEFGLNGQFYNSEPFLKGNETKASHNIIDLLEKHDLIKHDILHTLEIKKIDKEKGIIYFNNIFSDLLFFNFEAIQKSFELGTIKILTHEQFENNCYKIGD